MGLVSPTVTRELTLRVVQPADRALDVPVVLRYGTADPWAVHATFHIGHGQQVTWIFARDLLQRGLHGPAGHGDVRIRPLPDGATVEIALLSVDGDAVLQTAASTIVDFLRSTFWLCPRGAEAAHLDWDAVLRALLST